MARVLFAIDKQNNNKKNQVIYPVIKAMFYSY